MMFLLAIIGSVVILYKEDLFDTEYTTDQQIQLCILWSLICLCGNTSKCGEK